MSRHAKHLRPINETRRADGTLTSETASRLLRRRGGLASAALLRADGFRQLERARLVSALVRRAKSLEKVSCKDCKALGESMRKQLALLMAKPDETPITEQDARLLR